jgi:hypothetical protein
MAFATKCTNSTKSVGIEMKRKKVISNIVLIGLVSMFVDMSTEMVYPLVPLFLTATLGASPAIVGVIEGIAESIASLLKVFSGYIGDVYQNKKRLAFAGYSASVVYKIFLILATSCWCFSGEVIDRTGKGHPRTRARRACSTVERWQKAGGSFGLHKMFDMAGSSLGALVAYILSQPILGFIRHSCSPLFGSHRNPDHFCNQGRQSCEAPCEKLTLKGKSLMKTEIISRRNICFLSWKFIQYIFTAESAGTRLFGVPSHFVVFDFQLSASILAISVRQTVR